LLDEANCMRKSSVRDGREDAIFPCCSRIEDL
jgi:hypothetical protein